MAMDDIYTVVRTINFSWAFALLMVMTYLGIIDLMLTRACAHSHIPPEFHLWMLCVWSGVLALIVGLSEIFLTHAPGGVRVFTFIPFLFLATIAAKHGAFRVNMHKESVRRGIC